MIFGLYSDKHRNMESSTSTDTAISKEAQELDTAFTGLLDICKDIHEAGKKGSSQHLWLSRVTTLQAGYAKSKKNPTKWKEMFARFYFDYKSDLDRPIFFDDGTDMKVNDEWLKDKEKESKTAPRAAGSWSPAQIVNKGINIFFDAKIQAACIPLTEVYKMATSLSVSHGEKNVKMFVLPAKFLYHLYNVLGVCVPPLEDGYTNITQNITVLQRFIKEVLPNDSDDSGIGDGLKGFSQIMGKVLKSSGVDGDFDANGMESAVNSAFSGGAVETMGKMVQRIMKSVSDVPATGDVSQVLDKIGEAFKDPEVRGMLAESEKAMSEQVTALSQSVPTAEGLGVAPSETTILSGTPSSTSDTGLPVASSPASGLPVASVPVSLHVDSSVQAAEQE